MKRIFAIVTAVALISSAAAFGDPTNIRPVNPPVSGTALQDVLDSITVSGPGINVATDQQPYALFTNDASGGSVATFVIELGGQQGVNRFGLYSAGDPTNKALVFDSNHTSGDQALVSFLANGDIRVNGATVANGFGSNFGFYVETVDNGGMTFYTEDSLNPGGSAQALVFQGDDQSTLQVDPFAPGLFTDDEFIFAFDTDSYFVLDNGETSTIGKDFADFVVMVESITPIPAPAALLLGGLGLGLVGWLRRRVD